MKQNLQFSKELSDLEMRFIVAVKEFLQDWHKGDFELPRLAGLDAAAMESALVEYGKKLKEYEDAHTFDSAKAWSPASNPSLGSSRN